MSSCCGEPEPPKKNSCCGSEQPEVQLKSSCCDTESSTKKKIDWLFWSTLVLVVVGYMTHLVLVNTSIVTTTSIQTLSESIASLMNSMWLGLAIGIFFVGLLGRVPREFVTSTLGKGGTVNGIVRSTFAGVFLDLCSHGILLVAMRLYQRGASLGQVMAFLIASPWNSLSLTVILIALIGLEWTLLFIVCSMAIGIVSGLVFDALVKVNKLPANPNTIDVQDFAFWAQAKQGIASTKFTINWWISMLWEGIRDAKMLVRWLLLGVLLAAAIRTFVPLDSFQTYFGATLAGLGLTLVAATILEICSEGSTPIAADLVTRAQAPGNGFAFLMTGVSTDYTEIISLRETTKSWKIALFLPLVTVPQVVIISYLMNISAS